MHVIPLIFGLMPREAIYRRRRDVQIKPIVRRHLSEIGVFGNDEELVAIIKEIADQLFFTSGPRPVRKKTRVVDLRTTDSREYTRLRELQNNRCKICGRPLMDVAEHLDHKIPFRLVGDTPKSQNWQLLCDECNVGKASWFSGLQPPVVQNWIYGSLDDQDQQNTSFHSDVGLTLRYAVLVNKGKCEYSKCQRGPSSTELIVRTNCSTALPVFDHLAVFCLDH
jgi:hypothetical protein